MSKPIDKKLYNKIKQQAKRRFRVWPSVYASSWVVREYKKQGGEYENEIPNDGGLARWYDEEWIDVCQLPKRIPCGRPNANIKAWKKEYPYCRPSREISSKTPKIYKKFSKQELKKRCSRKKSSPRRKVS